MFKILAINPGSTSTKVAIYDDVKKISGRNIEHSNESYVQLSLADFGIG